MIDGRLHEPGDEVAGDGRGGIDIEAAGGVVLRHTGQGPEVLIVHRTRHGDWSLPKGKLDPGEDAAAAALREVEEETGVRAELGPELPTVTYWVGAERKRVRWFRMSPVAGDPVERVADHEIDLARWVPLPDALHLLTYGLDRRVLAHGLGEIDAAAGRSGEPDP